MRKSLKALTSILMTLSILSSTLYGFSKSVYAIAYSDLSQSHTFYPYIEKLSQMNVLSGFSDGTFRPDDKITRGQMAKIIVRGFNIQEDNSCDPFGDVPATNTFFSEITTLRCKGIVDGYSDGTFRPDNIVGRGAAMKFIVESMKQPIDQDYSQVFSDLSADHTFFGYVMYAQSKGIVSGYSDGTFRPDEALTRGAIAKMVANALAEIGIIDPIVIPKTSNQNIFSESEVVRFIDDDIVIGNKGTAKSVIVMFGGFDEPYTVRFIKETLPTLHSKNIASGDTAIVLRDNKLWHTDTEIKGEAYECFVRDSVSQNFDYVSIQTKVFDFVSDLVNTLSGTETEKINSLKTIASKELPYDQLETFETCLTNHKYRQDINSDTSFANNNGYFGSPQFIIFGYENSELNKYELDGAYPYSNFEEILKKFN